MASYFDTGLELTGIIPMIVKHEIPRGHVNPDCSEGASLSLPGKDRKARYLFK